MELNLFIYQVSLQGFISVINQKISSLVSLGMNLLVQPQGITVILFWWAISYLVGRYALFGGQNKHGFAYFSLLSLIYTWFNVIGEERL